MLTAGKATVVPLTLADTLGVHALEECWWGTVNGKLRPILDVKATPPMREIQLSHVGHVLEPGACYIAISRECVPEPVAAVIPSAVLAERGVQVSLTPTEQEIPCVRVTLTPTYAVKVYPGMPLGYAVVLESEG